LLDIRTCVISFDLVPDPIATFIENTKEVLGLVDLHEQKTGKKSGRRYGVAVLNKSGIVLLTACWEAFVEDTASMAFEFLLEKTSDPNKLPNQVLRKVAVWVREDKNELRPWDLAAEGWRNILRDYKGKMLHSHVSFFNTPKAGNVDNLFEALLGLPNISRKWEWIGMSPDKARERLANYIDLRGSIAHRVKSSRPVHKQTVTDYTDFVTRLAVRTANVTRKHVEGLTGQAPPWGIYLYGTFA
jgi:hypothetical protein